MTFAWNYGDILDGVATVVQDGQAALIHGNKQTSWSEFTTRTNNLARNLLENGARPGDKIAFYMRNCAEYSEGIAAAFKARLTHVNVNYRYIENELVYLLDNSDATVVIYSAEFEPQVSRIRDQLPLVSQWIEVSGQDNTKDNQFEALVSRGDGKALGIERSAGDMLLLYTGGTTGMPKGVMWRHGDLWAATGGGGDPMRGVAAPQDLEAYLHLVESGARPVNLALPPLMHGTGLLSSVGAMTRGGTCVTLDSKNFSAELALQAIDEYSVSATSIVGDAFARPMLEVLDASPGKYTLSSLQMITSSGVMWTSEIKAGLLKHQSKLILSDRFASSEALGMGGSTMTKDASVEVAKFALGPDTRVFTEDHKEVVPGSGESGMVAVKGFLPVGYYKDQAKTDKTFVVIGGDRYSIPGDWAIVEADGSLTLLGRGSNCINTAGEKVFPEEVEEALKFHESIADALVVGLADKKWGQAITAVVQLHAGFELDEAALKAYTRQHLAAYKLPKNIIAKPDLERAPNGKADYRTIKAYAEKMIGE